MASSNSLDLKDRLRELGVSGELRAESRQVSGITWDVLIGTVDDTILVFVLAANGLRPEGYIVRILNCQECNQLAFSQAIDTIEDLRLQAKQQATRQSRPGSPHVCQQL